MSYGLWLSAGGLQVNEYRQAILANNMANVETVGFKRDFALLHERPVEAAAQPAKYGFSQSMLNSLGGGVWTRPTYTSFAQGELESTGRDLDAAIIGEGFFTVSDGDKVRFTRDGRFTTNAANELVLSAGDGQYRVLDDSGAPVVLEPGGGKVTIGRDGTVQQGGEPIARLGVVTFADPTQLRKIGSSLIENAGNQPPQSATPVVESGHVERSTVNPIETLTSMIEASRAYELNARMISLQDATIGEAVNRVGRIG
jgi:flagellar basal body rod protein FlgG